MTPEQLRAIAERDARAQAYHEMAEARAGDVGQRAELGQAEQDRGELLALLRRVERSCRCYPDHAAGCPGILLTALATPPPAAEKLPLVTCSRCGYQTSAPVWDGLVVRPYAWVFLYAGLAGLCTACVAAGNSFVPATTPPTRPCVISPLRRACYAWLSLSWVRRHDACAHLGLPLRQQGELDAVWGKRVMAAVKEQGLEQALIDVCARLDAGLEPHGPPTRP